MHPYPDQLPVDLIAQLGEDCAGVKEVKFHILLSLEQILRMLCIDCLESHTWLCFEGNMARITHGREFRVQEAKSRRQLALASWSNVFMNGF